MQYVSVKEELLCKVQTFLKHSRTSLWCECDCCDSCFPVFLLALEATVHTLTGSCDMSSLSTQIKQIISLNICFYQHCFVLYNSAFSMYLYFVILCNLTFVTP